MNVYDNLLPVDGEVFFFPAFFNESESDHYYKALLQQIAWKQEPIIIFGKEVMQPRLTAWYGDEGKSYRYSGITMQPEHWTEALLEIKQRIEIIAGVSFNSALLNRYRDGHDSMGWHADDERELGTNPVIASVSLGATRRFRMKHLASKETLAIDLTDGSLLVMAGTTQHHWQHAIPKTKLEVGERINLTFRWTT
mgnify:CR=1 FL=1